MHHDIVGKQAITKVTPGYARARLGSFSKPTKDARRSGVTADVRSVAGANLYFVRQGRRGTLSVYHADELTRLDVIGKTAVTSITPGFTRSSLGDFDSSVKKPRRSGLTVTVNEVAGTNLYLVSRPNGNRQAVYHRDELRMSFDPTR